MNIEIRYGTGGAPLWHVTALPGQTWRLKISRFNDASMAFFTMDGSGEAQDQFPSDPGTYWFFLYNPELQFIQKISYTIPEPTPPPPTPPVPSPTPPPGVKVQNLGPIGSSCTFWGQGEHGNFYYMATDYLGDTVSPWNSDQASVLGKADRDARCHVSPDIVAGQSPATKADLAAGLAQLKVELDAKITTSLTWLSYIFSDSLNSVVEYLEERINTLLSGLRFELTGLLNNASYQLHTKIDLLRAEILALVDPIWSALAEMQAAAEEESNAWRKGILDIEGKLRSWIENSILDILWAALTRPRKEA